MVRELKLSVAFLAVMSVVYTVVYWMFHQEVPW